LDGDAYVGNIAIQLEVAYPERVRGTELFPVNGSEWRAPRREALDRVGWRGKLFYEIHPQLWGQVGGVALVWRRR
jgi:hypothetical protein